MQDQASVGRRAVTSLASFALLGLIGLAWPPALAADLTIDPVRVQAITPMVPKHPVGLERPISEWAEWAALAKRPPLNAIVKDAENLLTQPLPMTSDNLFLEYSRTGDRTHWQDVNFDRRGRIVTLVLAECIENQGRFFPALNTLLKSLCEETARKQWRLPSRLRPVRSRSQPRKFAKRSPLSAGRITLIIAPASK